MESGNDSQRMIGKVKWFSDQKGYGFIARDESTDVFVHHSAIEMEGFRTLQQGEDVYYELRDSDKGPQAVNVGRVGGAPLETGTEPQQETETS